MGQRAVTADAVGTRETRIERERTRLGVGARGASNEIELEEDGNTFASPVFEG